MLYCRRRNVSWYHWTTARKKRPRCHLRRPTWWPWPQPPATRPVPRRNASPSRTSLNAFRQQRTTCLLSLWTGAWSTPYVPALCWYLQWRIFADFTVGFQVFIYMVKVRWTEYNSSQLATMLQELTFHRITQCYLPPSRGDISALTPAEAGTHFSDPRGMQGWVDLVGLLHTEMVYPPEDGHPSTY